VNEKIEKGGLDMELQKIDADVTVDVSGLQCPVLGLTAAKVLADMQPEQIIEIKSSDSGFKDPMRILARKTGNKLLGFYEADGNYRAFFKKGKPLLGR
jgi:TusA-related sulfurtransferase